MVPAADDEAELVRRAQAGDSEAFCALVRAYQASLRGLCARLIPSPDEGADVVQEAFVRAWLGFDRFEAGRPFGPWMRTICRNLVANHLRDRRAQRTRAQLVVDEHLLQPAMLETVLPETDDSPFARVDLLRACCEGLPAQHRALVRSRYEENLTVPQIAERLGRSVASIAMALSRLRASLFRCIRQRLTAAEGAP